MLIRWGIYWEMCFSRYKMERESIYENILKSVRRLTLNDVFDKWKMKKSARIYRAGLAKQNGE